MLLTILLTLGVMTIVAVLSLRLVPDRWNSVDIKVGLKGLHLTAEEAPDASK